MKELYSDKTETAGGLLDEIYQDGDKYKSSWATQAKQCVAFANGDQTIGTNAAPIWVDNDPVNRNINTRINAYLGDEIQSIVRVLVSYMTRAKPSVEIFADSKDEKSKNIASIAKRVMDAKHDIDHEYENSKMAATWALVVGHIFSKDYWDPNKGLYIPSEDGSVDEEGQPAMVKTGNNATAILTPMSITVDHSVLDFDEQPYIGESYVADVDWAKEAFDKDLPGYTGKASQIVENVESNGSLNILEEMKYSVPRSGGGDRKKKKNTTLVHEWYVRPNRNWTKGRMLIKAGGVWVYDSLKEDGSSYFMPLEEMMWHPYTMFGYEPYLGRFLYKSLVEGLIHDQVRLNEINGAILENANTLAKPNMFSVLNQLVKGVRSGHGAKHYYYKEVPSGARPYVESGTPLPSQFFEEKKMIIDHMVRKAGTNFVMQGQPPTGVSAASAIAQLLENATSQYSDLMISWEKFHEQRYTKKLRVIHKFHQYPDKNLEKYLQAFNKDSLNQEIKDFVGVRDLSDGLRVKIEYGSQIPKSETAKRQIYTEMGDKGLLGPLGDPTPQGQKLRNQMLERLGEKPFDTEETIEMKKVKWENDRIKRGLPVEVSEYDVGPIHIAGHVLEVQDPKFLETASDEVKINMDNHIKSHKQAEAEKAQADQQAQVAQAEQEMARRTQEEELKRGTEILKSDLKSKANGSTALI